MDAKQRVRNHGQLRLTVGNGLKPSTPARVVGSTLGMRGAKRKKSPIVVQLELRQLRLDVPDRSSRRA